MFVCEQLTIPYGDKMMNQHQTITVSNMEFNSVAAAIKHFDVPRSTAYKKIAKVHFSFNGV